MDIKVSVIIPVYNKEKYIKDCIDSVFNGQLSDIEVIAVDDGSLDNSKAVLEKLSSEDSRIKLIVKENSGSSSARNMGIKNSKGKYILFLDADDYLEKGTVAKLYEKAEDNDLQVVVFDIIKDYEDKSELWGDFSLEEDKVSNGREYLKKYLLNCCIPSACNKLWKRSLFIDNNIFFPEDIDYGEDGATVSRLMINELKVGKINKGLYHYKIHESSKIFNNNSKVYEYLDSYNLVMNYLEEKNFKCSESLKFTYKYTYAYKILEEVTFFDKKMKAKGYRKLYKEFLNDVKVKENKLMFEDDKFFNKKAFFRSNIIVKSYKISSVLGNIAKIMFKNIKVVAKFIK